MSRQGRMNGQGSVTGRRNMTSQGNMSNQGNMTGQGNMTDQGNMSNQTSMSGQNNTSNQANPFRDYGSVPVIFDMDAMTKSNNAFRTVIWTGRNLQVALMSLQPGEDIGVEMHQSVDQFIRIEQGDGIVKMGNSQDDLSFHQPIGDDDAIIIPAGSWHNIANTGDSVMKLYSIYAPPSHPYGAMEQTKQDAEANKDI